MSVYIYSGKDLYRLEEGLELLLKEYKIGKDETVIIDGADQKSFRMDAVMFECDMFSLFETDHKAVIVKDPYFLNAGTKAKESEKAEKKNSQNIEILESYLKHPNPQTLLIFYCHGYDADTRKKEYKLLTKYNATVVNYLPMKEKEFAPYAKKMLAKEGIEVDQKGFNELLIRVANDTLGLHNAIELLKVYGEKNLDLNDIRHLVPINPEVNMFELSKQFIAGNLSASLKSMQEMLDANYDYAAMISMLASALRSLYNMKLLYEKGMSEESIAVRLHLNQWFVKYRLKECTHLSSKKLLSYLKQLADLDQDIKSSKVLPKDGFETFLLKNGNNRNAGYQRII